jgi:hypothetical protein
LRVISFCTFYKLAHSPSLYTCVACRQERGGGCRGDEWMQSAWSGWPDRWPSTKAVDCAPSIVCGRCGYGTGKEIGVSTTCIPRRRRRHAPPSERESCLPPEQQIANQASIPAPSQSARDRHLGEKIAGTQCHTGGAHLVRASIGACMDETHFAETNSRGLYFYC